MFGLEVTNPRQILGTSPVTFAWHLYTLASGVSGIPSGVAKNLV